MLTWFDNTILFKRTNTILIVISEVWLVIVGLGAGVIGSIIGLGGGIIVVPVLTYAGLGPSVAAANSLFATLGNAAASTAIYSRQHRVHFVTFAKLAAVSTPGTILGAIASDSVDSPIFKLLFALMLASCIAYMVFGHRIRESGGHITPSALIIGTSASFGAGIVSSFFGIGGGVIFVPVLVLIFGYTMHNSTATSQAILIPVSLAAIVSHAALGHPDYYQAFFLMGGAIAGGLIGAQVSVRINDTYLKIFASAAMGLAALKLALDSVFEL